MFKFLSKKIPFLMIQYALLRMATYKWKIHKNVQSIYKVSYSIDYINLILCLSNLQGLSQYQKKQ